MTKKYRYMIEIQISLENMDTPARREYITFGATKEAAEKLSLWLGQAIEEQVLMLIREAEERVEKQTVSIDPPEDGIREAISALAKRADHSPRRPNEPT